MTTPVGLFSDPTTSALKTALSALNQRQQVTTNNIANAATPGYHAQRVSFEQSLAQALANGQNPPAATAVTTFDAGTPADVTGNTVQLDAETMDMQTATLQYSAVAQALSFQYSLYRTAVAG